MTDSDFGLFLESLTHRDCPFHLQGLSEYERNRQSKTWMRRIDMINDVMVLIRADLDELNRFSAD
jgi:hypothetical protein